MTTGAIYCRISKDREGLELGVDRQLEDCRALANQEGIEVSEAHVFIENDVGASTKSRKPRPQYEALKQLVAGGVVQAVVFYSNSRLTRRPLELEEWIALHERTKVRLLSKVSGEDNLSTADGMMVARIKASVDTAEADRISERVKRSFEQRRASGLLATGGPRPFGFDRSAGIPALVPDEVEAIRRGCAMVLAGGTLGLVARDWTERGLKPVKAATWTRDSVRSILRSPRIAGLISHQGEVVGLGAFPAIVDRATWEAVVEALDHGPRLSSTGRVHLLSGFLFCGVCGNRLYAANAAGQPNNAYRCVKERQGCGSIKRSKTALDELVDGYVREKLEQADTVEIAPAAAPSEVAELEQRLVDLRARQVDLEPEDFFPLLSDLRTRLNEARKREAESVRSATRHEALHDPLSVWESGTLQERRALLAALVKGIYVKPVGRIGRAAPPPESVEIVPA